jgi:hypothetical protein
MTVDLSQSEYEALRKELDTSLAETWNLEKLVVGASAAFWSWLLIYGGPALADDALGVVAAIPFVLAVLAGLRSAALFAHINTVGAYLRLRELDPGHAIGWENYLKTRWRWYMTPLAVLIWLIILLGNGYCALHVKEWVR